MMAHRPSVGRQRESRRAPSDPLGKQGASVMTAMSATVEKHHRKIIAGLLLVILFFAVSCTFHDTIPICHYLFGCDHGMHAM
jgi:hypothetical protein